MLQEDARIAYSNFNIFDIMYAEAYRSLTYGLRRDMMEILVKVFTPMTMGFHQGWELVWSSEGATYYINVTKSEHISVDLRKLRWAHELRVVQIFYLIGTMQKVRITVDRVKKTLNNWVLDQVKNVPTTSLYTALQEEKFLLKQAQPASFKGEGANIERDVEVWIEAMEDYFEATGTQPENLTMLSMFRLVGDAKIWWKQHCRDLGVARNSQNWEDIKEAVMGRYLPLAHRAIKMNEFFSLKQLSCFVEEYYSKFVTLRRYAPKMTL
ncbi:hypothetical protein L7F22_002276 [Adiantum nelumboides]|nr:hypothetical protein [Adiantum nelumboides]